MFHLINWISTHVSNIFIIEYYLLTFYSALEPVLYNGSNVFDRSSIDLNITPQSDYSSIELTCIVDDYTTYPTCLNLTQSFYSCVTRLTLNGVLGCNYSCYFVTKKFNYNDTYSNIYQLTFGEYSFLSQ
jgi:hypothetical protein